ncbi:MAG TPA: flavoprotein [Pirellulales bacterium]|jgi:phosphopantothenoylcysteine decarboxylase/phosphopantothenate--cysteine ligase|nr:flavoprotein [Pirellulales bacterium]
MNGRRLVVGVTGGIAAYKTAALVSRLVQSGAQVDVVMTRAAEKFVGPDTFAALTGRPVLRRMFGNARHPLGSHIDLAAADLLCVAPATANFMAKAAHGLSGDLLGTVYLAFKGRVLLAPAMNDRMWQHPAVQRNAEILRSDGVELVGPDEGWLSCRTTGPGRMADPEQIQSAIERLLAG